MSATNSHSANQPIAVGDLVQVVRSCCAVQDRWLGTTFVARAYTPRHGSASYCCGKYNPGPYFTNDGCGGWAQWYLKRIPPLSELEGVKTQEDIREPA